MREESEEEIDLVTEIQKTVDAGENRNSEQEQFLKYLKEDVSAMVNESVRMDKVEVSIQDVTPDKAVAGGPVTEEKTNCQILMIGKIPFPNDHRMHQHGSGWKSSFKVETRQHEKQAWVEFCGPNINEVWEVVRECTVIAGTAAAVGAIISGAGAAVFYPVFYTCLEAKIGSDAAKLIGLTFRSEDWHSCWTHHC